jgi:tetratricopeptide (TPR) repeat protein
MTPRVRWIAFFAAGMVAACQATPEAKTKSLAEGAVLYESRQLEEAESIADRYITANPSGSEIAEAYYLRGLCRFTRGSRPLAATDFQQALERTSRGDLKVKAHRALGDIAFESQDWPAAQKHYEAAFAGGPGLNAASITSLQYRMGVCLQSQGLWQQATAWFGKVAANADDLIKDRAVARMYVDHFALQFGAFQDPANARNLVAELRTAGVTAAIESDLRDGQFLYLVRSGSYTDWAAAAAARDQLMTKYPLLTIVP